jgi:hypothetical protein
MNHVGREGWRPRPRRSSVPRRRTEASDRKSKEGRMNRTSIGLIAEVMAFPARRFRRIFADRGTGGGRGAWHL